MADDGRQVTLHSTAGVIAARAAIVTAGPWSSGLLASVSVPIPGRPTLEQVAYLRPAGQDDAPIFVCHDEQTPYGVPVPGSRLYKIGIHPSGPATDPDAQNRADDQQLLGRLAEVARRYLPSYNPEPVTTERCVYDNSPDEDFIIDRIGNIVVGCGTSGHGFKFGPLLGEWLADLATRPAGIAAGHGLMQRFAMERFGRPD
jgi:sarcosine oxidase